MDRQKFYVLILDRINVTKIGLWMQGNFAIKKPLLILSMQNVFKKHYIWLRIIAYIWGRLWPLGYIGHHSVRTVLAPWTRLDGKTSSGTEIPEKTEFCENHVMYHCKAIEKRIRIFRSIYQEILYLSILNTIKNNSIVYHFRNQFVDRVYSK